MPNRKPSDDVDMTLPLEGPKGGFDVEEATDSLFGLLEESGADVDAFDVDEDEQGERREDSDEQSDDEDESDDRREEDEEDEDEDRDEESDEEEDSEEEDAEADDSDDDTVTYKVKVDGQEIEVTQDELLRGYSRTQDYTRKTQALAEERRAQAGEREAVAQERATYQDRLNVLEEAIKASTPPEPDWDKLRREDPARYAVAVADHQRRKDALAAIEEERQKTAVKQQEDARRAYAEHLITERARMVEAIPEWADEAVAREEKDSLAQYAKDEYGYTDEDLDAVSDHRIMVILRKAAAYDRLQKGKEKLTEKKKTAKVLKPGAKQPGKKKGKKASKQGQRARQRLAKTGNVHDAAATLYDMIDDDDL